MAVEPPPPLVQPFLRLRYEPAGIGEENSPGSWAIEMPASVRSGGVRVYPGMPFGIPMEQPFDVAGIPSELFFDILINLCAA
jgi:hypothetical protein